MPIIGEPVLNAEQQEQGLTSFQRRPRTFGQLAIELKWVHGKQAVVEPARVLPMAELISRMCPYQ